MKYPIVAATAALCLGLAADAAGARELTFGSYTSPTNTNNRTGIFPTMERITEATGGELTFEPFTGGSMGGPKELLGNIGNGVLDAGSVVDIYVKSSLPISAMLSSLIVIGDNPKIMAAAMNEMQLLNCPGCVEERERNNVIGLAWSAIAAVHVICNKPVKTLADLQGVKIIAPSGLGIAMQGIGATPVSITTAEMYEAMQRGQTDCAVGSTAWLDAYNLRDMAQSVWSNPIGSYFGVMNWALNLDVWNDLTDEEKAAFTDNMAQNIGDILWAYEEDNEIAIEGFRDGGGSVTDPGQEFKDAWAEQQEKAVSFAVEKGKDDGIENAQEIIDTFLGLVEKWTGIVEDGDGSKEAYIQALQTEIFDKI